ncbi:MAG TPA: hypothetical protein VJ505_09800 [Holophagaceae bacterium]|nr:hypothetical protein [Holophagaceae bacterium]
MILPMPGRGFAPWARAVGALLLLLACGGGTSEPPPPGSPAPLRLKISGKHLLGPDGRPVLLHGANLRDNLVGGGQSSPMVTAEEAADLALQLRFNFVRLRMSFEQGNRDDADPSGLSLAFRQELLASVELLRAQRIWILLEMRTDDETANHAPLYDPASPEFASYKKAWLWIARTFRTTDWIAGYGLLAEPSPDKAGLDPVPALIGFQSALMEAITGEDARTPFFVGPAYNYDTLGYRWDAYQTDPRLAAYRGRLVYEVNLLMPKPWIVDGSVPTGVPVEAGIWPQASGGDFEALLQVAPGETFVRPRDDERIFTKRRQEAATFPLLMTRGFPAWYLGFAQAFADRHQVPLVMDQFGASTTVNTAAHPDQQLAYEQAVIEAAEAAGMGWCRWIYSGHPLDRSIAGNPAVHDFYARVGAIRQGPGEIRPVGSCPAPGAPPPRP